MGHRFILAAAKLITLLGVSGEFASGIAWNRFGSHLWFLQTHGIRETVGFLPTIARVSKWTTKAVPGNRTPKAAADFDV